MTIYQAGPEVLVNTTTAGEQNQPSIVTLNNGDYVVVWTTNNDGYNSGIYCQRYNSSGTPLGTQTLVNTTTIYTQNDAAVAALSGGGYVVTWTSEEQAGGMTNIISQRFDSNGVAVGLETLVNTFTSSFQYESSVVGLNGGGYVITWTSVGQDGDNAGIYLQRYDANGVAQGTETLVNTTTASLQQNPAIAAIAGGEFVVSWAGVSPAGNFDIFIQRFDALGAPVGLETVVNTTTIQSQSNPDITTLNSGDFVVSWIWAGSIRLQQFDSSGASVGGEVAVSSQFAYSPMFGEVTALTGGGYVVVFSDVGNGNGNTDIFAQRFDASGAKVGPLFQVNTSITGYQIEPVVTATANDGFVVSWTSADVSDNGIYTRTFSAGGDAPLTVADTASSTEDGYLAVNVVQNDSDADATALTVVPGSLVVTGFVTSAGVVLPVNGGPVVDNAFLQARFSIIGGNINYTPFNLDFLDSGQSITVTITYDVTDGLSNTTQSTLTFTINGANEIQNLTDIANFGGGSNFGDNIFANGGDDFILALSGNDFISGGTGDDQLYGGDGNDTVNGDDDDDFVSGGSGADKLYGGNGEDELRGGSGDDALQGGAGGDILIGGGGIDMATYLLSSAAVSVDLGNGTATGGDAEGDSLTGFENLAGSAFDDELTGSTGANLIIGGSGDDSIDGMGGADSLYGNLDDDHLEGGAGADLLHGGQGSDTVSYASSNAGVTIDFAVNLVTGGHATGDVLLFVENIEGSGFNDTLNGALGQNIINGLNGDDNISGYSGDDILSGGDGNDTVHGNIGDDDLSGGDGDDSLYGGDGDDRLEGGYENDQLYGGGGNDTFAFSTVLFGTDTVYGWVDGEDVIDLTGSGLTFASFMVTQVGGATHLTTGLDTIILTSTLASSIDVTDFVV